jgi:Cu(I)/Ag(I) efflux system protein CusF
MTCSHNTVCLPDSFHSVTDFQASVGLHTRQLAVCVLLACSWPLAQAQAATPAAPASTAAASTPAAHAAADSSANMATAEVRRIDLRAGKITLRHGEIKSLDMPPMTMVFQAVDPGMLQGLKVGDQVLFEADQVLGAYRVTRILPRP